MQCCSGLSESLRDFDLYEMTVSPLVLALLVWVVESVLRNRLVFFPLCSGPNSLMLEECPEGDRERPGAGLSIRSWQGLRLLERPTGPETGCGVSFQVTLALL